MLSEPIYMIYAPIGGFGNHIRWLLLLDKNYKLELDGQTLVSTEDKVKFITTTVYPTNRTYDNWLDYEFNWRRKLDTVLKFTHDMTDFFDNMSSIAVTIDPDLAFRCYKKFNPSLNGQSKENFLKQIRKQNFMCQFANDALDNVICIDATKLFQPTLNKEIYNRVIEFFDLDSNFDDANTIHQVWYSLHINAENQWLISQNNLTQLAQPIKI
jgi:hypothetical protein